MILTLRNTLKFTLSKMNLPNKQKIASKNHNQSASKTWTNSAFLKVLNYPLRKPVMMEQIISGINSL
jgi:hypothetical protein